MSYQKKDWQDLPDITTPVTATDLDRMENGIADANGAIGVDAYDSTSTYAVGDLCMYNNTLYTCITTISTAEAWNANHWQATSIFNYLLLKSHPVGSYYWSSENTSPATLFGGTWTQVKDKFVLAAGDTYSAGTTGGSATHTLTINEMPEHNHEAGSYDNNWYATQTVSGAKAIYEYNNINLRTTSSTGGGQPFSIMPPYEVAYCWKRTA